MARMPSSSRLYRSASDRAHQMHGRVSRKTEILYSVRMPCIANHDEFLSILGPVEIQSFSGSASMSDMLADWFAFHFFRSIHDRRILTANKSESPTLNCRLNNTVGSAVFDDLPANAWSGSTKASVCSQDDVLSAKLLLKYCH